MFILNSNDTTPLYKQLYNQIREYVLSGKLPANSRLPSVRDLAAELSTSRNTVEGAYQELYAEGYIYSRQRSGYFVSVLDHDVAPLPLSPKPRKQSPLPQPSSSYRYDFHPARLDPASFPTALWRTCLLECLRESARELSQYGDPQGDWGLRSNIQQYLERSRGVICEPDQIVICAGLQQSLDMVAHLSKESHSSVAVENPGYHLPRAVFRNNSFDVVPVAVTPSGLDLDRLTSSGSTIVYVTPSHQLPMGCVMPIANRLKLIEWAASGGNLILEDDYDSELRYHGKPIPSLQGLRPDANIVYLGTFSKVLSPALRLSYLVLPRPLLASFHGLYQDYFATVSLLEQRTMAKFMEQGHWMRHVRRMRILYQKKHDTLLQAIEHHFGGRATVIGQGAGLHVVLQLHEGNAGEQEIIRRAAREGIRLFPFSATCITGEPASTNLLLGFGGMSAAEIDQGIELLSRLCFLEPQ
ncbi:PLP-dependent aminotransferase family protein [Geobacter sp. AOG1]|uniref:MocR-like pyridoxine biosynthesis transcription factor PdxR n=1 Tax=Geobacter sp. AOG1 TaxID=1566346 RepID=UPI001CC7D743|nr:PLP-dependent aminotransferase family protein [Geobacter sp. AOG1]GFE58960.1 GntR family transcriptional regulator [Geobacter sp. AOG1]